MEFYDKENPSLVLDKVQRGTDNLLLFKPQSFIWFVRSSLNILVLIFTIFTRDKIIFVFTCLLIFWKIYLSNRKSKNNQDENEKYEKVYNESQSLFYDSLTNIRLIKAFSNESKILKKSKKFLEFFITQGQIFKQTSIMPMITLIDSINTAFVLWYGGRQVISGVYDFSSFTAVQLNTTSLTREITYFLNYFTEVINNTGKAEKFIKYMDTKLSLDMSQSKLKNEVQGQIEFRNVEFTYPTRREVPLFKNLNFTINKGEVVAFVGPSGCGKVNFF
jgi:ABC-type multidrug transport system fused ATPase/permease subunit